jgi:hypothetical protein
MVFPRLPIRGARFAICAGKKRRANTDARYQVELELPRDWPDSVAVLREVGDEFPSTEIAIYRGEFLPALVPKSLRMAMQASLAALPRFMPLCGLRRL